MGKSYGTCYHKLKGDGIGVTRTDIRTRDNEECLSYGSYCKNCTLAIYESGAMEDGELKDLIAELKVKLECKSLALHREKIKIKQCREELDSAKQTIGETVKKGLIPEPKRKFVDLVNTFLFASILTLIFAVCYRMIM